MNSESALSTHYLDKTGFAYTVEAPTLLDRAEREPHSFMLFIVELDDFPRLPDDMVLARFLKYGSVNRTWSDKQSVNHLSEPMRGRLWTRLVEEVKKYLVAKASSSSNGKVT